MRRARYTDQQKEAIAKAVQEARVNGTWNDAFKAAGGVGYKGTVGGLMQLLSKREAARKAGKRKGQAKRNTPAPTPEKAVQTPEISLHSMAQEELESDDNDVIIATMTDDFEAPGGFDFDSIPEAFRTDVAGLVRAKIEKEFKHTIKDSNLGEATTLYSEIFAVQRFLDSKIQTLRSL